MVCGQNASNCEELKVLNQEDLYFVFKGWIVNHDIQRNFALCFSYVFAIIFALKWISRRWFCTFSDTYGSILHIFFSRNTSLSAQVTTDESKATLSFGLIIHIRKRLLWTTYTRFTPLSSRSLSSLTCRPF